MSIIKTVVIGNEEYNINDSELRELVHQLMRSIASNNNTFTTYINDLNSRLSLLENQISPTIFALFENYGTNKNILDGQSMEYYSGLNYFKPKLDSNLDYSWEVNYNGGDLYHNYFKCGFNNNVTISVPNNLNINILKIYCMEDKDLEDFTISTSLDFHKYTENNNIIYYFDNNISGRTITFSTGWKNYWVKFEFGQLDQQYINANDTLTNINVRLQNLEQQVEGNTITQYTVGDNSILEINT